jgi:hypothetical protein
VWAQRGGWAFSQPWSAEVLNLAEPHIQLGEMFHQHADLTAEELWLRYYLLGGWYTQFEVERYLDGSIPPMLREHNLMALALNQHFEEMDLDCFVPFIALKDLS